MHRKATTGGGGGGVRTTWARCGAMLLLAALVAWPAALAAQETRSVSGKVTATETLRPLPGVQVSAKGTSLG